MFWPVSRGAGRAGQPEGFPPQVVKLSGAGVDRHSDAQGQVPRLCRCHCLIEEGACRRLGEELACQVLPAVGGVQGALA